MTDISSSGSLPPPSEAPPPSGGARYDPSRPDGRNDAFQAALRDAGGDARAAEGRSDRTESRDEDDQDGQGRDGRKRRKGAGEGKADAPPPGAAKGGLGGLQAMLGRPKLQDMSDKSGLAALTANPGGGGGAGEAEAPSAPGGPDLAVFAQMLEDAAARAQVAAPNQAIQVTLNDARGSLEGVSIARLPDGSLSMTLQASPGAVTEVTRTLESLRRRLEAKGVTLGELKLAEEGEARGPDAPDGAGGT